MNKTPIGIFDSGIGGISVVKQMLRFLPNEKYIYLGDTARVPYGNKSKEIVKQYAYECATFLKSKNVKMFIVACNTVSSVALETVKEVAGDLPVIAMINPAAIAAVRSTRNGRIGVIGTRATINSEAYKNSILEIADTQKIKVISTSCPLFVPLVEEGLVKHQASILIAEEYLKDFRQSSIDTLVLGCTHYPFLTQLISEILPDVTLIDTGEQAAIDALRQLASTNSLDETAQEKIFIPSIEFFVTDFPDMFYNIAIKYLGFELNQPVKIDINRK